MVVCFRDHFCPISKMAAVSKRNVDCKSFTSRISGNYYYYYFYYYKIFFKYNEHLESNRERPL